MLWKVFLLAAVMLVCCGPVVESGRQFPKGDRRKSMFDDWFNKKYLEIKLPKAVRAFLDQCMIRLSEPSVPGIRRECRLLSDEERGSLFTCFKRLANSGYMLAFEAAHRSVVAPNAHVGPCFVSWHRFFLKLVEIALQLFCDDPSITLCWWDITLDTQLPKPCESALFTDTYFGNENGSVTTGPYAYKNCTADCIAGRSGLFRECGQFALPSEDDIDSIINAYNYTVMASPDANGISLVEGIHGWPHMFVGGQMSLITCSTCDFIFFLYHCFLDKIVDENLKRRNADVDDEYPRNDSNIRPYHNADDPLRPFLVRTCVQALRPRSDDTPYAARPIQCSDHEACGSKALWCNRGRCIACVRGGASMVDGWPDRACYIEGCDNPVNANGTCGCGGV